MSRKRTNHPTSVSKHDPSDATSKPSAQDEYRVGPGRPPREHQFRPGQSGNPKGAKRKTPPVAPELKELFARTFNRKVKVTQGEQERLITMWEAGLYQLSIQFAKGDRDARRDAFFLAEKLAPHLLTPPTPDETMAADHQTILRDFLARQLPQRASSAYSPELAPPELFDDDSDSTEGK